MNSVFSEEGKKLIQGYSSGSVYGRNSSFLNGCGNESNIEGLVVHDVPVHIRWNMGSTCSSTAPSTPNSREPEKFQIGNISEYNRYDIPKVPSTLVDFRIFTKNKGNFTSNNMGSMYHSRILIEITKSDDFSFLLCCELDEGIRFSNIKLDQRLLVDFYEFPNMLVDLLNRSKLCIDDGKYIVGNFRRSNSGIRSLNNSDTNKYTVDRLDNFNMSIPLMVILNVESMDSACFGVSKSFSSIDSCSVNFVESNHYKEIIHLTLPFESASETLYRDYLLRHLCYFREICQSQQSTIKSYESEIHLLHHNASILKERLEESKKLSRKREDELSSRFNIEMNSLAEHYQSDLTQIRNSYENDRRQQLMQWNTERLQNESRIRELEEQFKELENMCKLLRHSKLELEEYIEKGRLENEELKMKIKDSSEYQKKILSEKQGTERELELLRCEYNSTSDNYKKLIQEKEENKNELGEVEKALEEACKEIEKGNHIITSLQTSLTSIDNKYKQQTVQYTNLKRIYQDTESRLKALEDNFNESGQALENAQHHQEQLLQENERLRKVLNEAEKQIEINQNVINTLKKQISSNELGDLIPRSLVPPNKRFQRSYTGYRRYQPDIHDNFNDYLSKTQPRRSFSWSLGTQIRNDGYLNDQGIQESHYKPQVNYKYSNSRVLNSNKHTGVITGSDTRIFATKMYNVRDSVVSREVDSSTFNTTANPDFTSDSASYITTPIGRSQISPTSFSPIPEDRDMHEIASLITPRLKQPSIRHQNP
ncbi:uncharacterized protein CMU_024410 [Cryptosporidium muris RN66]|uniref:Spindle assembly abnormal protein 6 N-terminal domain-containing protein n=1 Tax=Cryptosporidium muris (strain RN66) TaxID=441375 RepID=B6AAN3_CRYMR|nr:uncharacterized protein CMU_024410 [Cryptosporidium muris RN66]EEA05435.1 hypothetical protein, conserved [Cryptosporidium muris RN66]|eukprot:XP_002139784.1 hypothetical protein [Cryptosporidium muris RN66]